jgi:hypothetical protein
VWQVFVGGALAGALFAGAAVGLGSRREREPYRCLKMRNAPVRVNIATGDTQILYPERDRDGREVFSRQQVGERGLDQ